MTQFQLSLKSPVPISSNPIQTAKTHITISICFSQLAPIILNLQFHLCYSSNTTQTKLLKEQKKKGGLEIIITSQDSVFGILDSQLKDIRINGSQPIWVLKFSFKKFSQGCSFISP
jgi:hypothetical protein